MSRKMMIKTLTGLLLTLTLLNPVANADPFSTTWEWVEEHPDIGVPALFIDAPMMVFIAAVTDPETDDWFSQAADDVGEVLNPLNWF